MDSRPSLTSAQPFSRRPRAPTPTHRASGWANYPTTWIVSRPFPTNPSLNPENQSGFAFQSTNWSRCPCSKIYSVSESVCRQRSPARPGFSARAGPHRYSLAQAILPIGLPAAGGRRIGRWTCRRAAQPAGRAHAGGRPRRLVGLEVLRLLELILGRRDLQLVGSVVLALHDIEGGGRDGHMLGPEAKETAHAYNDSVDLPALVEQDVGDVADLLIIGTQHIGAIELGRQPLIWLLRRHEVRRSCRSGRVQAARGSGLRHARLFGLVGRGRRRRRGLRQGVREHQATQRRTDHELFHHREPPLAVDRWVGFLADDRNRPSLRERAGRACVPRHFGL